MEFCPKSTRVKEKISGLAGSTVEARAWDEAREGLGRGIVTPPQCVPGSSPVRHPALLRVYSNSCPVLFNTIECASAWKFHSIEFHFEYLIRQMNRTFSARALLLQCCIPSTFTARTSGPAVVSVTRLVMTRGGKWTVLSAVECASQVAANTF